MAESISETTIRFAVVTVSDSCSKSEKEDISGKNLIELIQQSNIIGKNLVAHYEIVPDDTEAIEAILRKLCDSDVSVDVIITTGGTGFSQRDVTPEATKNVLTKDAPGLVIALINRSLEATPFAALSRLAAGVRGRTVIVNFPGNVKAVQECWQVLEPLVRHIVDLISGNVSATAALHENMTAKQHGHRHHRHGHHSGDSRGHGHGHHSHHHSRSPAEQSLSSTVDTGKAAFRPRESPYPAISFRQALDCVLAEADKMPSKVVDVHFMDALNAVLAEDVRAPEPQPPFPASIKDGYAVLASDGAGERVVIGVSTAGDHELDPLQRGTCMRISTGAPVPKGADAVVQVEDTNLVQEKNGEEVVVFINKAPTIGQDIRPIGCDVSNGEIVLTKGTVLTSAEIGILASVGKTQVRVYELPTVAILSTGNELMDPLKEDTGVLTYGKIRDTNRPELIALLQQHGFHKHQIADGGICVDEPDSVLKSLRENLQLADVLVTSGGVSMGEKDLLKQILMDDLSFHLHFARVQMKPGKPTTFATGVFNGKPKLVFGLPGNPVSAWVTAQLYVLPALKRISGRETVLAPVINVKLLDDYHLDPRPEFVRAALTPVGSGDQFPCATITESNQMSSRLLSTRQAHLLLMLPPKTAERSIVKKGEFVPSMLIGRL